MEMVHGYHVVWGTYGFWLPNDPRGSWSDMVHSWELARFGHATKSIERLAVEPVEYARWRERARSALKYPPVTLTDAQAKGVAEGFRRFAEKSVLTCWACSILPEHVHMVLARHRYKIEQAVNLLKGEATRVLVEQGIHPMEPFRTKEPRYLPSMWAENGWKVFLDSEVALDDAIRYVEENPAREGIPAQRWSFVKPFRGQQPGWITYH
jgi:REP element-mobilizing transposase RayT